MSPEVTWICVAHNPEVAGSNPAPATRKARNARAFVFNLGSKRELWTIAASTPTHSAGRLRFIAPPFVGERSLVGAPAKELAGGRPSAQSSSVRISAARGMYFGGR
jgi:hypothetical protein